MTRAEIRGNCDADFAAVRSFAGNFASRGEVGAGNLWMTFVEVPEGSWGVGGRPVSIESLSPVFAEDRQQRIKNHLAAERSNRE